MEWTVIFQTQSSPPKHLSSQTFPSRRLAAQAVSSQRSHVTKQSWRNVYIVSVRESETR
jgi:hypothetical protein